MSSAGRRRPWLPPPWRWSCGIWWLSSCSTRVSSSLPRPSSRSRLCSSLRHPGGLARAVHSSGFNEHDGDWRHRRKSPRPPANRGAQVAALPPGATASPAAGSTQQPHCSSRAPYSSTTMASTGNSINILHWLGDAMVMG